MKRDLYEQWIAVLEDPKSRQTYDVLKRRNGGRCCLGVLSDLAGVKSRYVEYKWGGVPGNRGCYLYDFMGTGAFKEGAMPPVEWACDKNIEPDIVTEAADMNDNGKSFKEIAAYLREQVEAGALTLED